MAERILVTSALPYVNGIKHLGNLAGSLLPADVHARFHRLRGREVLFVCGTDEHGTPAELAALEAGLPVAEFCARQHAAQAGIFRELGLSFDHFGRTSSQTNHALTRELFLGAEAAGFVEEREIRQVWSPSDGRFLPDRYVVGTCPHCGSGAARGDQCDDCGRLLDATDLLDPRSAVSGEGNLEVRPTRHIFLRLSKLADRVRDWVEERAPKWEALPLSIARAWLDQGLQDRCITRDLSWGVPVPREGFEGKSFYVWYDAPIGYLSLVHEWAVREGRDWGEWLSPGPGTLWTAFVGKDNVAFHAVTFPAAQLASGTPYRGIDTLKAFEWITWGGEKFSTSQRRGIFLDDALREFPADAWRWWLTANAPEGGDVRFTPSAFAEGCNADLADNLGNLANRLLRFAASRFPDGVPDDGGLGGAEVTLAARADAVLASCTANFEAIHLRRACADLRALWSLGNAYVTERAPWTALRSDPCSAARSTRAALGFLALAATAAAPVVPGLSATILAALGRPAATKWPGPALEWLAPDGALAVTAPPPLFPRIPPERVRELEERYGG